MNEVSNLFVCLMGMGTTFVGLICIIFLTMMWQLYVVIILQVSQIVRRCITAE